MSEKIGKMNKKEYIYIGIILILSVSLAFLIIERQGQISVCYDVYENIINK